MPASIKFRLAAFASAIGLLAIMIGWAARTTWREVGRLQERFNSNQIISFQIADHLQATILDLNNDLLRYQMRGNQTDWQTFLENSQALNDWIDEQKPKLPSPKERRLLNDIDRNYDFYLSVATNTVRDVQRSATTQNTLGGMEKIINASMIMLGLGYQLEDAHREVLETFLFSSQKSVAMLQRLIFGSLLVLLGLGIWLSVTVYKEMIAPLRLKLVESRAIIQGQEKLASLGVLAAGVAHEIRNPLTAIKARLFTQQKTIPKGTPAFDDAKIISSEINRLERIVKDFLLFARPSDPQLERMDASTPLREAAALVAPQLEKDKIALVVEPGPPADLQVDPQQIKQVLINLIQNAADAIGKNGIITLRARTGFRRLQDRSVPAVVLEVTDTGKGIAPEIEQRLFDPFFTTKEGGTGLGLSIAASLIEKHGGALQYRTQMKHGTTFGIVLPRAAP